MFMSFFAGQQWWNNFPVLLFGGNYRFPAVVVDLFFQSYQHVSHENRCLHVSLVNLRHFVLFRKSRTCHDNSDNSASVIGQLARIKRVDMCALSRSHGCGLWQWLCMQKCRRGYLSSPLCHNCLQKTHNYWCTFSPWAQALTPADNVKAAIRSLIHQCLCSIWAWDHVLWKISVSFVGSGT